MSIQCKHIWKHLLFKDIVSMPKRAKGLQKKTKGTMFFFFTVKTIITLMRQQINSNKYWIAWNAFPQSQEYTQTNWDRINFVKAISIVHLYICLCNTFILICLYTWVGRNPGKSIALKMSVVVFILFFYRSIKSTNNFSTFDNYNIRTTDWNSTKEHIRYDDLSSKG